MIISLTHVFTAEERILLEARCGQQPVPIRIDWDYLFDSPSELTWKVQTVGWVESGWMIRQDRRHRSIDRMGSQGAGLTRWVEEPLPTDCIDVEGLIRWGQQCRVLG